MRALTVISGIIYVAAGTLCFLVSGYSFSSLAFPAGVLMVLAGLCMAGAFIASGKRFRLPDTVLVEGLIDMMFGFAALNNQVADGMISMFFGCFTCIAGATRLSQAMDISRYKPKDWAKVFPLSAVTAIMGVIMMMPTIIPTASTMIIVGASFIINGFSLMVYSMYMEKRTATQKEAQARARTSAKKAAAEAKRRQRDELRNLSKKERDEALARIKQEKREAKKARKDARRLEAELARASRKGRPEDTKPISKDDADEIRRIADSLGFTDDALVQSVAAGTAPDDDAPVDALYDLVTRPMWQKPTAIPSLRVAKVAEKQPKPKEEKNDTEEVLAKREAINLDALENKELKIEFEPLELRAVELISEKEAPVSRSSVISQLDNTPMPSDEFADYVPLKLEDLIAEELPKFSLTDPDDKMFTQRMSFTWGMIPISDDEKKPSEDKSSSESAAKD